MQLNQEAISKKAGDVPNWWFLKDWDQVAQSVQIKSGHWSRLSVGGTSKQATKLNK